MNFTSTALTFQAQINALAIVAGMTGEEVYELWRKYDRQCTLYDQSPVLVEFVAWYAEQLGGDRQALQKALIDEQEWRDYQDAQEAAYEESVRVSYEARGLANVY